MKERARRPGWWLWVIWLPSALFFAYNFFQRTAPSVMAGELMRDFAVGGWLLGNLTAFYFYSYAVMQLAVGVLLDRFGPRPVLTAAALAAGAGTVLFATAQDLNVAYLGRLLIGAGVSFGWIGTLVVIALWFPPRRFALMAGIASLVGMGGGILAQAPLAAFIEAATWREAMLTAAAVSFAIAGLVWLLIPGGAAARGQMAAPATAAPLLDGLRRAVRSPQTWLIGLYISTTVVPYIGLAALWGVPYLTQAHGMSRTQAALGLSLLLGAHGLMSPVMGWVSDAIGRRKPILFLCSCLELIALSAILYLPGLPHWAVHALLFLLGTGSAGIVIGFATGRESSPAGEAGAALSTINAMVMIAAALIHPAVGYALDLNWGGVEIDGARQYSTAAYQSAMMMLPGATLVGMIAALLIRETGAGGGAAKHT